MWRVIFVALVMLFPVFACASPSWQKRYTVDFRLGDADSRLDARHAALEDIRHLAAAEAESYVHTRTEYAGEEIREHIEVVSATMVLLENIQESLALSDSGQLVLQLSADATLDDRLLQHRIDALHEKESQHEKAERLEVENQRLKERVATAPDFSGTAMTLYDHLSSYSSTEYLYTSVTDENVDLAEFKTSVNDNDFTEFISQVVPRISDRGASLLPAGVHKIDQGWQLSFYLDWGLPLKALEKRLDDEVALLPANAFAWPGEGGNRGRKINLLRQRREYPASLPLLEQLARWRGEVVVTVITDDQSERTLHREPFWYLSSHRGNVCHGGDAIQADSNSTVRYLCLVEGRDRGSATERGVFIETMITEEERDSLARIEARIDWRDRTL